MLITIIFTQLLSKLGLKSRFLGYNYGVIFIAFCYSKVYERTLERKKEEDKQKSYVHMAIATDSKKPRAGGMITPEDRFLSTHKGRVPLANDFTVCGEGQ